MHLQVRSSNCYNGQILFESRNLRNTDFEFFMVVNTHVLVFWGMTLCSLGDHY